VKTKLLLCGPGDHDVVWRNAAEPNDVAVDCEIVKTVNVSTVGGDS
jgi:hypothetical protein